jgi:hypothetical protein
LFFVNEISCTSIKFVIKITAVPVALKSYFEIKDINNIKNWVCDLGGGVKLGIFLFGNTGFVWFHSGLLTGSAVMVSLW